MPQRNKSEIAFYRLLAGEEHDLPVVRCYAAEYQSAEIDRFHLLLDDPSRTTHRAFTYSVAPPTMQQSEQIVDILAEVQARCWETARFTQVFGENHAEEVHTGEMTDALAPGWKTPSPASCAKWKTGCRVNGARSTRGSAAHCLRSSVRERPADEISPLPRATFTLATSCIHAILSGIDH